MTSYSDTLQHGDIISCYQIEDVLGRGGFAVTYLATDNNLDVQVAIKEYLPTEIIERDENRNVSARRPEFAEDYDIGLHSFAREAKTLARFKHPNIVRVHQVIHHYNTAYMVMDYEHGQELTDVLANHGHLSEVDLRALIFPIFEGVEEIHRHGLAHRDIKPSNIYLRDSGSPVLLDFGAARYTMSESTQQLTAVVTVGYTPIEQYNVSDSDQGPWSDIYALAAVLYEAVTGEMPVDSVTRASSTLTRSSDPLQSVREKAAQPYSDGFLDAIDWGLKMDAQDRPQSIAQWRDSFDGIVTKTQHPEKPQRVAGRPAPRKSKLLTYADAPRTQEGSPHSGQSMIPERESGLGLSQPDAFVGTRYRNDSHHNDIESIPLHHNDIGDDGPLSMPSLSIGDDSTNLRNPIHANQNSQSSDRRPLKPEPKIEPSQSDLQDQNDNPGQAANSAANSAAYPQAPTLANTTHTQEIRNVLRRDIMKRDPQSSARPKSADHNQQTRADSVESLPASNESAREQPQPSYDAQPNEPEQLRKTDNRDNERESMARGGYARDEIQFDDTDWDYEAPEPSSRWRWVASGLGVAAVIAGSLLFVNRSELFTPELSLESALDLAEQKMEQNSLIFPAGESALDYFQLALASDPGNPLAVAGITQIERSVSSKIDQSVTSNDLAEANRLLSRANNAGLQIEDIPAAGTSSFSSSSNGADGGVVAIDTSLSPYIKDQLTQIETLISEGKFDEADALFQTTDKYLADVELSKSLRERIDARDAQSPGTGQSTAAVIGETSTLSDDDFRLKPVTGDKIPALAEISANSQSTPGTENNSSTDNSAANSATDGLFSPDADSVVVNGTDGQLPNVSSNTTTDGTADDRLASVDTEDFNIENTNDDNDAAGTGTPQVSAPRRSFIRGSGSTARHLNQLRNAIESKNLGQVVSISDNLPTERTEFLRTMFSRYDRLDVSIDNIVGAADSVTARLNVSMYNQRNDGSYYSAGKWNGVTLKSSQDNGQWQKIEW